MFDGATLYGGRGTGAVVIEAALALAGVEVTTVDVDEARRPHLLGLNPLGQVPTLTLRDGAVLTESAAIVLSVAEAHPDAALAPPAGDPDRARFLRWLVFLVAAVYPTWSYVAPDGHRRDLWRQLDQAAGAPWFLGERRSALDLYVAVFRRWEPAVVAEVAPRLAAIADRVEADPVVGPVLAARG
jgi:GST-like protein